MLVREVKAFVFSDAEAQSLADKLAPGCTLDYHGGLVSIIAPDNDTLLAGGDFDFAEVARELLPKLGIDEHAVAVYECGNQCFDRHVAVVVVNGINQHWTRGIDA